jgi:hypothetical protein
MPTKTIGSCLLVAHVSCGLAPLCHHLRASATFREVLDLTRNLAGRDPESMLTRQSLAASLDSAAYAQTWSADSKEPSPPSGRVDGEAGERIAGLWDKEGLQRAA